MSNAYKVLELLLSFETFGNNLSFHVLFGKVMYIWVGLPDFREGQVKNFEYKGEISRFSKAFQENMPKLSLND